MFNHTMLKLAIFTLIAMHPLQNTLQAAENEINKSESESDLKPVVKTVLKTVLKTDLKSVPKDEQLRLKLFKDSLNTRRCLTLPKSLTNGSRSIDPELNQFLNDFKTGIEKLDATKLLPLFHPRTVTNLAPVNDLLFSMKLKLGAPFEVSTFRLWAVNTVDGTPTPVVCGGLDHTELQFWPQFGYNLEFAIWIQVLGKQELGRIFATIVNKDDKWYIGALHYHQWTHGGKDYEHWFLSGKKDLEKKHDHSAFVKFDIATKLVDGKKQFLLGIHNQLKSYQKQILVRSKWESDIKSILNEWKVLYLNTILGPNGAGIIIRIEIPGEISANDLTRDCHKMGKTLKNQAWFSNLDGFKCSYVMKGENPGKEGKLGGIYLPLNEIGVIKTP